MKKFVALLALAGCGQFTTGDGSYVGTVIDQHRSMERDHFLEKSREVID